MRVSHENFELAGFLVGRLPSSDLPRLFEMVPEAQVICWVRARPGIPRVGMAPMLRDRFGVSRATAYRWLSLIESAEATVRSEALPPPDDEPRTQERSW